MISFAGDVIVCGGGGGGGGGGFQGGMPKMEDIEGGVMGEVGRTMGVGSEEDVPAETKAGAIAQTRSSYIGNLQDPGMSMLIGSGVWSRGSLIESGVLGSERTMSSSIGEGVCHSASESIVT